MRVQKYNISKPRKYVDKSGNEKTQWNNIGVMTEFHKDNGEISRILEIPAISLEANIFPFQEQGAAPASRPAPRPQAEQPHPAEEVPTINIDEEIDPKDLPF